MNMASERDLIAEAVMGEIVGACGGSEASTRGSLAAGTADELSDIDLLWVVAADGFERMVKLAPALATRVCGDLEWARVDAASRSSHRRLLFLRFRQLPLFWRVDLEIQTRSAPLGIDAAEGAAAITDDVTDLAASAFENAVAAVKALQRGQATAAVGLLDRGFARIDGQPPNDVDDLSAAVTLAQLAAARDARVVPLANRLATHVAAVRERASSR